MLLVAAVAVWFAGARLSHAAEEIARRRELGRAFAGLPLLGMVTSLPEIATTATGSIMGDAALVTSNLYGGVAAQTCIIAAADLIALREPLTHRVRRSVLMLQAASLV